MYSVIGSPINIVLPHHAQQIAIFSRHEMQWSICPSFFLAISCTHALPKADISPMSAVMCPHFARTPFLKGFLASNNFHHQFSLCTATSFVGSFRNIHPNAHNGNDHFLFFSVHRISTFAHTGTVVTAGGAVALRGGPHERGSFNLWRRGIRNLQFQYPDWIFCFVLCLPAGTHKISQSGFESARRFCVQKLRHTLRFSRSSKRRVWDSNPRETFAPNTLARCRFRPLSQLSNTSF